jgi:hypothetical protein
VGHQALRVLASRHFLLDALVELLDPDVELADEPQQVGASPAQAFS